MKPHNDIESKLTTLGKRLEAIGHFPARKEDEALYQLAKYYYANYPDHPMVEELKSKFPYIKSKSPSIFEGLTFDEKVDYLEFELRKSGRIPPVPYGTSNKITSNTLRFYSVYSSHPKVIRLMWLYPSNEVYDSFKKEVGDVIGYIQHCIDAYKELPGTYSLPMIELRDLCRKYGNSLVWKSGKKNPYLEYVIYLIDNGFVSDRLLSIYNAIER